MIFVRVALVTHVPMFVLIWKVSFSLLELFGRLHGMSVVITEHILAVRFMKGE